VSDKNASISQLKAEVSNITTLSKADIG